MPSSRPLDTNLNAVFGTDGVARGTIGPTVYGDKWRVRRMVVSTDSAADTDARVYLNLEIPSRMVAGSYSGNQDFNETDITLQTLDRLIVVWNSGTPAARAAFLIQGTIER
jgi:hypothetical protein